MSKFWTVQDLANALVELDQQGFGDSIIILSSDEEGNGYLPMRSMESNYRFDPRSGDVGHAELTPELKEQGFTDEDVMTKGKKAVLIWP